MKRLQVAVGVVKNTQGQVLISLRDEALHQGGLWEFPGGKIESGESPEHALVRELKEELGLNVNPNLVLPLITVKHQYSDLAVQLNVFLVEDYLGEAISCEGQAFKWVEPTDLKNHQFPEANQPIIAASCLPTLYAILDDADNTLLDVNLKKILSRGIKLIQLRLKTLSTEEIAQFLEYAYPLCKDYGAIVLINAAVNYSKFVDGVHLSSQQLMSISKRPDVLDHTKWLAASCHNLEELRHAQLVGVDFVVLAPVLFTQSHPETTPLGWEQFTDLVAQINLPVYALGGLSERELATARQCGAQGISAIRAFIS